MVDFLKRLFSGGAPDDAENREADFDELLKLIDKEMRNAPIWSYYDPKPSVSPAYKALKKQPTVRQTEIARYLFENRNRIMRRKATRARDYDPYQPTASRFGFATFRSLMRGALDLEPEEILGWADELHRECGTVPIQAAHRIGLSDWPIAAMIQAVERHAKKVPLSDAAIAQLQAMLDWPQMSGGKTYYGTDFTKLGTRIRGLLGEAAGVEVKTLPYKKLSGDTFGDPLEAWIKTLGPEDAAQAHQVLNQAASASGAKPTKAFLAETKALQKRHGKETIRTLIHDWLGRAIAAKSSMVTHRNEWGGHVYEHTTETVFTDNNIVLLKGLVWMCGSGFQDSKTVNLVADLCEKSTRKVPNRGPAAQATANACLWYLEVTPGAEATARLSRFGTAIKQKGIQKRVREIVAKKAEQAGITTIQLEERVVPGYGLAQGTKTVAFDDYALRITVDGPGRLTQTWLKPDGQVQKTKPKVVVEKAALKTKFDRQKAEIAALKKVLTAQRDRIDKLFAEDVDWPLEEVVEFYVGHGLVGTIGTRLIWMLRTGGKDIGAIYVDGAWQDVTGTPVAVDGTTRARLWHPVEAGVDDVLAWRARLAELDIVQPMKQAHREVYLLTDAERRTDLYSNRMAAHMLKQHQMATLMAARGWRYQLMGAYDDGLDDQFATKTFVTSPLRAEYLTHTNWDGDHFNDAGIYLYVGTDQLRFVEGDDSPVKLDTVPPRLFSEVMREADLFVGVASVGNDPAWFDQGPTPEARTYWQSYSFGDLDGFAETRKQVLGALIPRLKIRDVARIEGKYLYVEGKLNTYKIHLGSSNILMEPGDRYLCIVPGAVSKAGQVALPFEGDARMSVILSKALMLADDDKIKAPDITSQLKRFSDRVGDFLGNTDAT
ncbi:MAG: DUF4132 domain-containing protein [Pseudomonadota bacterium]